MASIPIGEAARINETAEKLERVLGIKWKLQDDTFVIPKSSFKTEILKVLTQRNLLKFISSVFDPIGFLSPFIIQFRKVLQTMWRKNVTWDTTLQDSDYPELTQLVAELTCFDSFRTLRLTFPDGIPTDLELHVFCDASITALSTVAYYRFQHNHCAKVRFVLGKSRVAPMKQKNIPKLELHAAVMGLRVAKFLVKESNLSFSNITFWTDSTVVLSWLNNHQQKQNIFVSNRVEEILKFGE